MDSEGAKRELVLASASPRRKELLRNAQIAFVVAAQNGGKLVLGADTIVVLGDEVLEKPRDEEDAARMLRRLSGRTHQVITGVCLLGPEFEALGSESTDVTMAEIPEDEIAHYVATGEPMDKAGAYAIQGMASRWVTRLEGDYFNVVGLPVALVYRMLRERGAV